MTTDIERNYKAKVFLTEMQNAIKKSARDVNEFLSMIGKGEFPTTRDSLHEVAAELETLIRQRVFGIQDKSQSSYKLLAGELASLCCAERMKILNCLDDVKSLKKLGTKYGRMISSLAFFHLVEPIDMEMRSRIKEKNILPSEKDECLAFLNDALTVVAHVILRMLDENNLPDRELGLILKVAEGPLVTVKELSVETASDSLSA